jgi:peptide/nickel transport system substrate-binding protein
MRANLGLAGEIRSIPAPSIHSSVRPAAETEKNRAPSPERAAIGGTIALRNNSKREEASMRTPVYLQGVAAAAVMAGLAAAQPALAQSKPALTVAMPVDLTTTDPHRISAGSDDNMLAQVYETLYGIAIDGSLEPLLATSVDISDDGLTYDFTLRQGVRFHNGNEFTAEDVQYSWQRGVDPNILNPRAVVVLKNIENIEVVDKYHARMKLKTVDAATLNNMVGTMYMLDKEYMTSGPGTSEDFKPMGTGPFEYVERQVKQYVKLKAFEGHWGRVPQVGEVTMRIIPDPQARFAAVQTGEADIVSSVPAFTASKEKENPDYRIIRGPGLVNLFMHIHNRSNNPDLKKPEVRRAFNMAVDRKTLNKAINYGFAIAQEGAGCGPAVLGCDNPPPTPFAYDPEGARKMLQEANFDFSRPIGIITPASGSIPQSRETAEAIAHYLQQIGVKTDLIVKEYGGRPAGQAAEEPDHGSRDLALPRLQPQPGGAASPVGRNRRLLLVVQRSRVRRDDRQAEHDRRRQGARGLRPRALGQDARTRPEHLPVDLRHDLRGPQQCRMDAAVLQHQLRSVERREALKSPPEPDGPDQGRPALFFGGLAVRSRARPFQHRTRRQTSQEDP